ncbi:MAG: hypothetical protein WCD76_21055 [Pyrinomonadaceae bacterium]
MLAVTQYGPTVVLLVIVLGFLIRVAPMWKEIRLKEIEMRGDENVIKREQSNALTLLAGALRDIAVEQRRATEEVGILQRANNDTSDQLAHNVQRLNERLDKVESSREEENRRMTNNLVGRMDALENHVGSQSTTAGA